MKKFPDTLHVSCPDCEEVFELPDYIAALSPIYVECPYCGEEYLLKDGRLLPKKRRSLTVRAIFETKNKKTVYDGDLLNETPETMRQRGRFLKDK